MEPATAKPSNIRSFIPYVYQILEFFPWTKSNMVKYRAAIWSFLKLTALYFTMSDIVHGLRIFSC